MKVKQIPEDIKEKVEGIIKKFNAEHLKNSRSFYSARFRGKNLYLDRNDAGRPGQICRLTYTGKMNQWDFAIFRWSREKYDPDEWFFPGAEHVRWHSGRSDESRHRSVSGTRRRRDPECFRYNGKIDGRELRSSVMGDKIKKLLI